MSKHWNPDEELAWLKAAEELADRSCPQHDLDRELARPRKPAWPPGATAGLVLVASCCLALGLILYQVAGPRDVVEDSVTRL